MAIKSNTIFAPQEDASNFSLYIKNQLEKTIDKKITQESKPLFHYSEVPSHLNYTILSTLFGQAIVAYIKYNIYYIGFFSNPQTALTTIKNIFKDTNLTYTQPNITLYDNIFVNPSSNLNLWVKGTTFQINVWQTLCKIKPGTLVSYTDIASLVNKPTALRAVGNALGKNNISWLIPCHRVVSKNGSLNNYAWSQQIKKELILHESTIFNF